MFAKKCQKTLTLAFNTIFDYKMTFVNSHHTTFITYKVIVVFPGHIDKDLDYFWLIKSHVSSQGGADGAAFPVIQHGGDGPLLPLHVKGFAAVLWVGEHHHRFLHADTVPLLHDACLLEG